MPYPKGHPRPPGSGRKAGVPNKRTVEIKEYARTIVEDEQVREQLRAQARDGTLPPPIMTMLFYYAYGKPKDNVEMVVEHKLYTVELE